MVATDEFRRAVRAGNTRVVRSMALWFLIIEGELEFAEFIISGLTEEGFSDPELTP